MDFDYNKETGYQMEELIELVAKLAEQYVSAESSSVSYEAAQTLMDAVRYTICTQNHTMSDTAVLSKLPTAKQAYEAGNKILIDKVMCTMDRYNQMVGYFDDYHNKCLEDTVIKGMPEFFRWYDVKYNPQNTLLTLDYPILKDLSHYEGIWRIEAYLECIELEQLFLSKLDRALVIEMLSEYNAGYRLMIDNLCEIVYQDVLYHLIVDKPIQERISLQEKMQVIHQENISKEKLNHLSKIFINTFYQNERLLHYLSPVVDGLIARMMHETERRR